MPFLGFNPFPLKSAIRSFHGHCVVIRPLQTLSAVSKPYVSFTVGVSILHSTSLFNPLFLLEKARSYFQRVWIPSNSSPNRTSLLSILKKGNFLDFPPSLLPSIPSFLSPQSFPPLHLDASIPFFWTSPTLLQVLADRSP